MAADETTTAEQCLEQVRPVLTAAGFDVGGPAGSCGTSTDLVFSGLPGRAQAELYETSTGTLTWIYTRLEDISAQLAVQMTRVLLGYPPAAGLPPVKPGQTPRKAISWLLAAAGLFIVPVDYAYQPGEIYPELLASRPGDLARGLVRITLGHDIVWDFRAVGPGSPRVGRRVVASAIAGALGEARHVSRDATGLLSHKRLAGPPGSLTDA